MKMHSRVTFFEGHKQKSEYLLIVCFLECAARWDDGINLDTFFLSFKKFLFFFSFCCGPFFKVFVEFVTTLLFFMFCYSGGHDSATDLI